MKNDRLSLGQKLGGEVERFEDDARLAAITAHRLLKVQTILRNAEIDGFVRPKTAISKVVPIATVLLLLGPIGFLVGFSVLNPVDKLDGWWLAGGLVAQFTALAIGICSPEGVRLRQRWRVLMRWVAHPVIFLTVWKVSQGEEQRIHTAGFFGVVGLTAIASILWFTLFSSELAGGNKRNATQNSQISAQDRKIYSAAMSWSRAFRQRHVVAHYKWWVEIFFSLFAATFFAMVPLILGTEHIENLLILWVACVFGFEIVWLIALGMWQHVSRTRSSRLGEIGILMVVSLTSCAILALEIFWMVPDGFALSVIAVKSQLGTPAFLSDVSLIIDLGQFFSKLVLLGVTTAVPIVAMTFYENPRQLSLTMVGFVECRKGHQYVEVDQLRGVIRSKESVAVPRRHVSHFEILDSSKELVTVEVYWKRRGKGRIRKLVYSHAIVRQGNRYFLLDSTSRWRALWLKLSEAVECRRAGNRSDLKYEIQCGGPLGGNRKPFQLYDWRVPPL